MIYFYNIHNKDAVLEEGLNVESREGSLATGWDLWTEMMRYPNRFEPEYFKYYSCVATIDCEPNTHTEAWFLTNSEEDFANNYHGKVTPLTGSGNIPSMSVGDIVLHEDGKFFMCMPVGWKLLEELTAERAASMKRTEDLRNSVLEDYKEENCECGISEKTGKWSEKVFESFGCNCRSA